MISKQYLKHLGLTAFFYLILVFIFCIYLFYKGNLNFIDNSHFLRFDARLYQDIKDNGYYDSWLCAFFPAFPFLWKIVNFSGIGISILNSLIFIFCISSLSNTYKIDWKRQLFFLSIPSFAFMFVPYTEALFFATGTLLIIGLKENKLLFIILGLLLGSLVRPTTFVFIPAILGCYLLAEKNLKQSLIKSVLPITILIIGLFLTMFVHFYYTNKWFVFFEAQKLWKNYLHFPTFPLKSWGGDGSTRFDGSALAISIICGIYVLNLFSKKLKNKAIFSKDVVFSLLYMCGTSLLIIAYRDGNLYSLNRFIYATPFIIVVLYYFFTEYVFRLKHVWFVLVLSEIFWLLFESYNHLHNLLLYSTVSLYFIILLFSKHTNKTISTLSILSLIVINCIGILKLYYRFLNNVWIG